MMCLRHDEGDPIVPSTTKPCAECGADLWVSWATLEEDTFTFVCEPCALELGQGRTLELLITAEQRAYLRLTFGFDDDDIDQLIVEATTAINHRHPEEGAPS